MFRKGKRKGKRKRSEPKWLLEAEMAFLHYEEDWFMALENEMVDEGYWEEPEGMEEEDT